MRNLSLKIIRSFAWCVVCAVVALLVQADTVAPVPVEGSYTVKVGGFYSGSGQGSASGGVLSVTATVTDDAGTKSDFSLTNGKIDVNNRFTGSGTVSGKSFTISGRLDPVTSKETQLKTARLTGTYSVSDGHHGRLVGFVPYTPGTTGSGSGTGGTGTGGTGTGGSGTGGTGTGGSGSGSGGTGSGTGPGNPDSPTTPTPNPVPTPTPVETPNPIRTPTPIPTPTPITKPTPVPVPSTPTNNTERGDERHRDK